MATSVLAQLSAAKDRIAELTPVAGMDWRETMQRLLTRMGFPDRRDPCGITPEITGATLAARPVD